MLNYVIQQIKVKHVMIMRINRHIINHEPKVMDMDGMEEILLERVSIILIIQGVFPEVIGTSSINPFMKGTTVCR
jgi:hypothetical protein